ncbi:MAG: sugar-binding protein [Phycisphaerae bacterium]
MKANRVPRTLAAACGLLLVQVACAEVVTVRLATGLPPTPAAGRLPEAWVAPAERAPTVDGRLDDPAWAATRPVVLGTLESRGQAAPRTEARLVHKDRVLYAGVRLAEPNVAGMKRSVTKADGPAYRDDSVELFLSPHPDGGYFQMIVSATGAIYDRRGHGDPARWNAGATAAVEVGRDAWTLEVAVPMSALGVGEQMPRRWRANLYRNRRAGGSHEGQAFSPTFSADYDVPERFGCLRFTPTCPWAESEEPASGQRTIAVEAPDDGTSVLRFDLSPIPEGATVHRARLRCEREPLDGLSDGVLEPIDIRPLAGPSEPGATPRTAAEPLRLVPPWYEAFEITEWVGRWAAGKGAAGVRVKTFPGWRKDRTVLDVMYEGRPQEVPPAASGVQAFHRAGQTFLTWREITDPVGRDEVTWGQMRPILRDLDRGRRVRYAIYRSDRPISPETLHQAERIALVRPLSGWNLAGRNIGRPIDRHIATAKGLDWHQWNPFRDATVDGDYGLDCPIDRFVVRDGEPPLARGTGLYVHTAADAARAWYAVVTTIDGVENTRDVRAGLNVVGPLEERVGRPEPVLQGELPRMPFFNYDQRRLHYVRWVAPPLTNKPYDYDNWSVGVPDGLARGAALKLNLHRDGYSYWRTHYRIEPGGVVLCPYDFPRKTFWFGYHECHGTLRPWTEGRVRNYTEQRLLSFVDWAAERWPVDRHRILVTGCRGGASGSGALHLGLRHPEVFNMVIAGHGDPDYADAGEAAERLWGKAAWGLETASGRSVWDELDLLRTVRSLPPDAELPFVSMTYSNRQERTHALAEALMAGGHAVVTHTAWGGQRLVPVSATATYWCLPLDIRRDRPMLAVHNTEKTGDAIRNGSPLWRTDDLVDEPRRFAVTLRQDRGPFAGTITLRRLQRFQVSAGKRYAWTIEPLDGPRDRKARDAAPPRQGIATAGAGGVLRLGNVRLATGTYRLTVTPKR